MAGLAGDPTIEGWEYEEISRVAGYFRGVDRQDLRSELATKLWCLKLNPPEEVRHWKGYLRRFLRNKALNMLRSIRLRTKRESPFPELSSRDLEETLPESTLPGVDLDLVSDFGNARRSLPRKLRRVLTALEGEEFNQIRAARRMGVHRNTFSAYLRCIREILTSKGLAGVCKRSDSRASLPVVEFQNIGFIRFPNTLLDGLLRRRLTSVQLRLIFWVIRNSLGWNRATTSFTWYRIAKSTGLDRSGLLRAGRILEAEGILLIHGERIGIELDISRWNASVAKCVTANTGDNEHTKNQWNHTLQRRQASPSHREFKDITDIKERQSSHSAGAAHPVKGKYGHL